MDDNQTFEDGFLEGWHSVVGSRLDLPDVPSPSIQGSGSVYINGLMAGIEAAKKEIVANVK